MAASFETRMRSSVSERGVVRVVELDGPGSGGGSGDEGDDGDIDAVEPEDLGVEDDVFRVLVVGARADVGADLVEDGGRPGAAGRRGGELVEDRRVR
jgi:hypothetical protein